MSVTKISGVQLRRSFLELDSQHLNGQVSQRLDKLRLSLKFSVSTALEPNKVIWSSSNVITISLSTKKIRQSIDRKSYIEKSLKISLTKIIFIVWGYQDGPIFDCVYQTFFEEQLDDDVLNDFLTPSPRERIGFVNTRNSCYVDSLLMILFECKNNTWREAILFSQPTPQKVASVCSQESKITTDDALLEITKSVQEQLLNDYISLRGDGSFPTISCTDFRRLVAKCVTETKGWVQLGPEIIYDFFASTFTSIKMSLPVLIESGVRIESHSYIPMVDFLGESNYVWGEVDCNHLVFVNGGNPVKKFDEIGVERGKMGYDVKFDYEIDKVRKFGETILDEKYLLVGVVILHGFIAGRESGGHFSSFVKTVDGWYYYDDIVSPLLKKVKKLPRGGVWRVEGGLAPSMYFYERSYEQ